MSRAARFLLVLILGLTVATGVAAVVVQATTRAWFAKDLQLRAELAVNSAGPALVDLWGPAHNLALRGLLAEMARDERIMGAAACAADLSLLARTKDFPESIRCRTAATHLDSPPGATRPLSTYTEVLTIAGGDVHVSAVPVFAGDETLGFVLLVQDLAFVARREARAWQILTLTFVLLAVAASGITLVAARLTWRGWTAELHRQLRGETARADFAPVLRDVRDLVGQLIDERSAEREGGVWTPGRLKQTLNRHLHGERVIIVANREPYIHERSDKDGTVSVVYPASGLVTALEPVMHACSGTWVAHGSGSADRDVVDARDRVRVPPGEESYTLRRVWLSPEEEQGYYYGFSNEGLWPLCHMAHARPLFRSADWKHYGEVNRRFAEAVCQEVDSDDPIILVQDYHFALLPQLIRERLPRSTLLMFWHIPWPNSQHFGICPWRKELLVGMLGSSIVGFHTQFDCNNFLDCVDRFLEARIDREHNAVVQGGRRTLIRPYPISLDWPSRWAEQAPSVESCRAAVFAELSLPAGVKLGVGVDRLDYTKGVEERLLAVERLLDLHPEWRGRFTFIQLAAPSRTTIDRYRHLNEGVEQLAETVNRRFAHGQYKPIILLRAHHQPPTVFRYYRAADLCYVSSLHDGMNLVAKEYVAARDDEQGVLVLSQFTGAARELTEALIVNPYDFDQASAALLTALQMAPEEQRDRMRAMRAFVSEFNVYRWAGRMLSDAARLRSRGRLSDRLSQPSGDHGGAES